METASFFLVLSSLDLPFGFGALVRRLRDWLHTKLHFMSHEYLDTCLYSRLDLGFLNVICIQRHTKYLESLVKILDLLNSNNTQIFQVDSNYLSLFFLISAMMYDEVSCSMPSIGKSSILSAKF